MSFLRCFPHPVPLLSPGKEVQARSSTAARDSQTHLGSRPLFQSPAPRGRGGNLAKAAGPAASRLAPAAPPRRRGASKPPRAPASSETPGPTTCAAALTAPVPQKPRRPEGGDEGGSEETAPSPRLTARAASARAPRRSIEKLSVSFTNRRPPGPGGARAASERGRRRGARRGRGERGGARGGAAGTGTRPVLRGRGREHLLAGTSPRVGPFPLPPSPFSPGTPQSWSLSLRFGDAEALAGSPSTSRMLCDRTHAATGDLTSLARAPLAGCNPADRYSVANFNPSPKKDVGFRTSFRNHTDANSSVFH
jgi:hypothetical protein